MVACRSGNPDPGRRFGERAGCSCVVSDRTVHDKRCRTRRWARATLARSDGWSELVRVESPYLDHVSPWETTRGPVVRVVRDFGEFFYRDFFSALPACGREVYNRRLYDFRVSRNSPDHPDHPDQALCCNDLRGPGCSLARGPPGPLARISRARLRSAPESSVVRALTSQTYTLRCRRANRRRSGARWLEPA
jgi:hypothetical protein